MDIERFRQVRELRGLSKRQLSKASGVGEMQLGRYESGENDPSAQNLKQIAKALQVSADYLLGITDDPQGHFGDSVILNETELAILVAYRREGWAGLFKLGADKVTNK
jgi:transcriptional regulator with XRE-family HTH domain